jgi:hypothetical protein
MRLRVFSAAVLVVLGFASRVDAQTSSATLSSVTCPGSGCLSVEVTSTGQVSVQITGTFVGTIVFEKTSDGSTWAALTLTSLTGTSATSTTTTGIWTGSTEGSTDYRIRFSIYWSGSAAVTYNFLATSAISDAKYILKEADTDLPNAQSLGVLTTGLLKNTVAASVGTLSTAVAGTDYLVPGAVVNADINAAAAIALSKLATTGDLGTAVTIGSAYVYRVGGTDVSVADGGTGIGSYAVGDLLYADTTTTLAKLAGVAAGSYLRSGGISAAPVWSTLILPNACAINQIPYATSANTIGCGAGLTFTGTAGATTGTWAFGGATALDSSTKVVMTDTTQTIRGAKTFTNTVASIIDNSFTTNVNLNTGVIGYNMTNSSSGAAAAVELRLTLNTTHSLKAYGENFTTSNANIPASIRLNGAGTGGVTISASSATGDVRIYAGGTTDASDLVVTYADDLSATYRGTVVVTALAATSGTNYVCSTTTGLLQKSASACSGTEAEWIANIPALTGDVQWLRQEVSRLAAQVAALGGGR